MPRTRITKEERHSLQKNRRRQRHADAKPERPGLLWNARFNYNYFNMFKELPLLLQVDAAYGAKKKEYPSPKSILIISTSLIGDFIVSLPAINYYVNKHHDAEIDIIVAPVMQPLARNIERLRNIYSMLTIFQRNRDKGLKDEWKGRHYDLVLLMRVPKSILRLLKIIDFYQVKTYLSSFLKWGLNMYRSAIGKEDLRQMVDVSFEIMGEKENKVKVVNACEILDFKPEETAAMAQHRILVETEGTKRILIHTGSGWRVKFWALEKWVEFFKRVNPSGNYSFIFIGSGKQEETAFDYIQSKLDFKLYNGIKQFNIWESVLFFRQCDFFIGIDSGPRHIAHLLDVPSIVLLGPGPKTFEPLNSHSRIIDKSNCGCTNLVCFQKRTCMQKISADDLVEAFSEEMGL
jgi:ADP-heptose:LPS heptosyltransferase